MRALLLTLTLMCAALGAHYAGAPLPWTPAADWLYNVIEGGALAACVWRAIATSGERAAWLAMSAAVASFGAADLYYGLAFSDAAAVPFPSWADVGYLGFYPMAYLGLLLLLRARAGALRGSVRLDGVIAGLALAAIGAAVLLPRIVTDTDGDFMTVATNLAYPLGDLLLLVIVAGTLTLVGLRSGTTWWLIAAALGIFAGVDTVYLYQTATGSYAEGAVLDIGWPSALLLLAVAGWQTPRRLAMHRLEGWRLLALPTVSGGAALTLLVRDHYVRVDTASVWLATLCLVAVLIRLGLTFAENMRMLRRSRQEASTDVLTGLGNRRRLLVDLDAALEGPDAYVLALYDLDGFKAYNDMFGHAAGDALLARLGRRMTDTVTGDARVYRMGGDEFCLLASTERESGARIAGRAAEALSERGKGFEIGCSYGIVALSKEAETACRALQLADERMYHAKGVGRVSAGDQSKRVLLRAIHERNPELGEHGDGVADMAVEVAARLGLSKHELDAVRHAAELHDIGKIAIPDSILNKPGPLDEGEWRFMRRHTLVGERIIASAPALAGAARLVRSTHERYDGEGYPDRLAGDAIPLGARIIAVCDSWDAMTSDRSYRRAMSDAAAREELRRGKGTQFDASIVAVFLDVLEDLGKSTGQLAA